MYQFLQSRIACSLSNAVDGALQLSGSCLGGGEKVGHGHAQVVVAMDWNGHVFDALDMLAQRVDELVELHWSRVAYGVWDVDRSRTDWRKNYR